ncbi:hypothetical protein [Paractinoplanes rishiriensis]|uniref:Uncharacterized protein n=1 Tax=Paractinoplanes rishiriensis TaxID=1050105 RepID=A0A919JYJ7_9ACTN|nr:hypothetical protein [Actinoplanes rishiriensis]GIE95584.1 hypothetical protein Ari01nite_30490 [Actinoplanes rishiriensis]
MTRRLVLTADGVFLTLIGGVQFTFELLSYLAGAGPLGAIFENSHYTLGWVEAHGLATLIGILLLTVARTDGRPFWNVLALAVHALLGGANLFFWSSFGHFGLVPMGVAATVAHGLFVLGNAWVLWSPGRLPAARPAPDA